jgi:uncharacterized membrane-anchored protein
MTEITAAIEHPRRRQLNDEVHARPPETLSTPCSITYLVRVPASQDPNASPMTMLEDLLRRYGIDPPSSDTKHFTVTLDGIRLRWERHTEYNRYTFVKAGSGPGPGPFSGVAEAIPADWLAQMQGEVLVGAHAMVCEFRDWDQRIGDISTTYFDGNILVGSVVADRSAVALTDLRIHEDGFSRIMLINTDMSEAQAGRVMQRLLEIETYRMMALLALPVAQQLVPELDNDESELEAIGEALISAETQSEKGLLDRLTVLAANTQHRQLRTNYRFAAADAYYEIVLQRINELRESRIPGLQTFHEFTTRRLTPAIKTCRAASARQQSILEQMARATKLLSTRIDIDRQLQNQSLLASMNRRVKAQLRLQATVEGLSVAAVTYYVVGLVGMLADGLNSLNIPADPALVMAVSVPLVATTAYLALRRLRRKISRDGSH